MLLQEQGKKGEGKKDGGSKMVGCEREKEELQGHSSGKGWNEVEIFQQNSEQQSILLSLSLVLMKLKLTER